MSDTKIPIGWRFLNPDEPLQHGDRYNSNGFWFPVEIRTQEDYQKNLEIIRYEHT